MRPAGLDEPSVQLGTVTTEFAAPINAPSHAAYAPLEAVSSGNDAPTHAVPNHSFKAAAKVNASFGDPGQGMAIAFKDITYTVPVKEKGKTTRKQILKGVTGSIRSGSLNAIMGPSGGGKVPFAAHPPKLGRISPCWHYHLQTVLGGTQGLLGP
jgi:ABC-type multidrug transport system fused ATPase/permease subunit